jgi:hypothetical protein
MYKGFTKDLTTSIKNYTKTYGSRFLKWARTPVKKIKHNIFNRRP